MATLAPRPDRQQEPPPRNRRELEAARRPARHSIYVWELPVRLVHWAVVVALIVLSFTGYYIDHPYFSHGGPGHPGFVMGWVRGIHEGTGFGFTAILLFRIYWGFAGNRYASWRALLPLTRQQRSDLGQTLAYYGFIRRHLPRANGHNPLAGMAYVALYSGFALSCLTGLSLFAWVIRSEPWTTLFSWTWTLMSVPAIRLMHFLLMFWYIAFMVHHVYSAILVDIEERNGELASMITGYKADVLEGADPGEGRPHA
jgi:Ni/Fe-hydrogenase 1 B-type cytochrome subunit